MNVYYGYDAYFKAHPPQSNVTLSFHHHLRQGDQVLSDVMRYYHNEHHLTLMPSALFPVHASALTPLIQEGRIDAIYTNYVSGPLGRVLREHPLKQHLHLDTHGGRAGRLLSKKTPLDIAYLAMPAVDHEGNLSGLEGPNACGSLGYATADAKVAKNVILITDHYVPTLSGKTFRWPHIDALIVVPSIGQQAGIESGTTKVRPQPIHDLIAQKTIDALIALEALPDRLSFQTGAGSISLRIAQRLAQYLKTHQKTARFASGGISAMHVKMLQEGLVDTLYDVQCFDLDAVNSLKTHPQHVPISADRYANIRQPDRITRALDIVFLGAAQVDLNFNVNVTTEYDGTLIGGSGGHADTAEDAALTVVVSPLLKGRMPLILSNVTTLTTPGHTIDMLITEHGMAIHPKRQDLWVKATQANLEVFTIEALKAKAEAFAGVPAPHPKPTPMGVSNDRLNEPIDTL